MNKSKHRKMKIDTNPTRGAHGSGRFGFELDLQGGRKRHPPSTEVELDWVSCRVWRIEFQLKSKWQILAENWADIGGATHCEGRSSHEKIDLSSTKTYLSSMKGDLSTEKTDRAMAKGDLGKSTTKVDLGMMKVDLSKVKANMGKVKVDMNLAHSLFFSNLNLTCPLSLHDWSFKLCRSKPYSESSISPSLDTSQRGLVGLFWWIDSMLCYCGFYLRMEW